MGKRLYVYPLYFFVLLSGLLIVNSAVAEAAAQMTALEKKLYEAAKQEKKLLYWDSVNLKEAAVVFKAFNKRYPGIEVVFWEGNANQCDEKYFMETRAGRRPVDLMQIEWYQKYKDEKRLADLSDIMKDTNYPKDFASSDSDAVAIEHTLRSSAYNSKIVAPGDVPRTWEDLLDPKWKGKIAIENNMSVFITQSTIWGENKTVDYLGKLSRQKPIFVGGATHAMTLLGAGEFPIALNILLHRTLDFKGRGMPVDVIPITPIVDRFAPYVVIRDAPHPNAGKLYLRWLLSDEGQGLVDKIRKKGNPLPGAGTSQSLALEQRGMKVVTIPSWELDFKRLQNKYRKAVGFSKK